MKTSDFDFYLPEELIAQHPLEKRDYSKLMVLDKETGKIEHKHFYNVIEYLNPGDTLVLNNTRVMPARLIGEKAESGGKIEFLLLKRIEGDKWECLAKPGKWLHEGTIIVFGDSLLKAKLIEKKDEGIVHVKLLYDGILMEILEKLGTMPLPPYIHEKLNDQSRYQTVYAKNLGSAAAPTAGLHFTTELLDSLKAKGVNILYVTLHVGLGTFRPVEEGDITKHKMHSEYYIMTKEVADTLNKAKENNKNSYAVGTTSTRVLETVMKKYGKFIACSGETDIFIYPGFEFKAIDGLITNFHLPKSTLLMLVSALSKKEYILNAYEYAKKHNFRFFSFGDAMFIKNDI